jgi:nucleoside 2-deoxyribosyltransferase
MRQIYFAGSITGGREHAAVYVSLVRALRAYGTVLTEHVGDPDLDGAGETLLDAQEIFARDVSWVDRSDVMVADVTVPSLGVGYEIGRAEAKQIPVLALYCRGAGRSLSAMVRGNPWVETMSYTTVDQALACIAAYFGDDSSGGS